MGVQSRYALFMQSILAHENPASINVITDWYDGWIPQSSPIVHLTFQIAEKAHQGQYREKVRGSIPYFTHPVMVCKLLNMMGVKDDLTIAIALLHDVLEDCEPYKSDKNMLYKELQAGLSMAGLSESGAMNIAADIANHCQELSNEKYMEEGKRAFQVEHAHHMSDRSKLVKIIDQMASVVDDILLESRRPPAQIERYALKAINVVKSASRNAMTPDVQKAANLFKHCYQYLMELHAVKDIATRDQLRFTFDPNDMLALVGEYMRADIAKRYERLLMGEVEEPYEIIHQGMVSVKGNPLQPPSSGCTAMYITADSHGKAMVSGYDCMVDLVDSEKSNANRAHMYLLGVIESFRAGQHVEIGNKAAKRGELTRHFDVVPPIAPQDFLAATRRAEEQVRGYAEKENKPLPKETKPVLDRHLARMLERSIKELESINKLQSVELAP